jgi:hypothetical protein
MDFAGLAVGEAVLGLDAVIDRVADQVDDWIGEILDHRLVDFGFFTDQHQLDVLAQVAGQVAGDARILLEQAADGLHAGLHDRVLQIGHQQVELAHGQRRGRAAFRCRCGR